LCILKEKRGIVIGLKERGKYMADYLDLYEYRCRVATFYSERNEAFLAGEDMERIAQRFRAERDRLFAEHSQSALDEEQKRIFQGLSYFPYRSDLRVVAEIEVESSPQQQMVVMNADEQMTMATVGRLHFAVEGQSVHLSLYWLEIYGGGLFLPFRDQSCPQESYGGGRYLFDTMKGSGPLPGGESGKQLVLDFNYAYNPSCAYNSRWVCPLAPQENRLTVAIRAGEKKFVS
jgi:uncharacterized protein